MVTPIGLIMHELATNAAKYGAFSADGGTVGVSWELLPDPEGDRLVRLRWEEQGGPAPQVGEGGPDITGFGTRMTALAVSQLGGTLDRQWPASGAIAQFEFPVS
jgi:two-component sensor histidine kinase